MPNDLKHTRFLLVSALGAAALGCQDDGRVKVDRGDIELERGSTATLQEAITVTGTLWEEKFQALRATNTMPASGPYTNHDWYIEQHFRPNNEIQDYEDFLCNNSETTSGSTGTIDDAKNTICIVADSSDGSTSGSADDGDDKSLRIRAIRPTAGSGPIYSGRMISKRFHEFVPTASQGIKITARLKFPSHGGGGWPAFWMLGANIKDESIPGSPGVDWPCEGAHEIDIYEHGSLSSTSGQPWGPNYNKASMHYNNGPCEPQVLEGTLGVETYNNAIADGNYHTFSVEWEQFEARFLFDEVQYGQELHTMGLNFDDPMFLILNFAVGGNLGGAVNHASFEGSGKSFLIDWIKVQTFNPAEDEGGSNPTARSIASNLEAETHDGQSGLQPETCSEGGQNMGWTDPNDYIQWRINVPSTGDYTVTTRSAVNNPNGTASYDILVDNDLKVTNTIGNTGGWQNWQSFTTSPFNMTAGEHWLRIKFNTFSQNLNWLKVNSVSSGATCSDGIKNGNETGVDCGGSCSACPTCSDGVKNGSEAGVDCGGSCAPCNNTAPSVGSRLDPESSFATRSGLTVIDGPDAGTTADDAVGSFDPNDYIKFPGVNLTGVNALEMVVASAQNPGGLLEVRADSTSGTLLASYSMVSTGSYTTYVTRTLPFSTQIGGVHDLYLVSKTGSGLGWGLFDADYFRLLGSGASDGTGTGGGGGGTNLFANPSFINDAAGWQSYFYNGGSLVRDTSTGSDGNHSGKVQISGTYNTIWWAHLYQIFNANGSQYTVRFKAKRAEGTVNKTIEVFCEKDGGAYDNYGTTSCSISNSSWTTCQVTCTPPANTATKFGIKGGSNADDWYIDEASLTQ